MTDRYVYDFGQGRTMHLRSSNWGEPNMEIQFVMRDGGHELVSPPLPDVQLSILAHAFAQYFFERTGRVAWPVEDSMLHLYERKRQDAAERARHLGAPRFDIAKQVETLGADSLLPPGEEARADILADRLSSRRRRIL